MTTYYVDVSQTFNGDGTASTGAASDGAAGAWNDFDGVFRGTVGSLTDGDIVYIKTGGLSDTSSVGTFSIPSPTDSNNPIRFIFDDGTIWEGSDGVFTYTINTTINISLNTGTHINGNGLRFSIVPGTVTTAASITVAGIIEGVLLDSTPTYTSASNHTFKLIAGNGYVIGCKYKTPCGRTSGFDCLLTPNISKNLYVDGLTIEITSTTITYPISIIKSSSSIRNSSLFARNIKVIGTIFDSVYICSSSGESIVEVDGITFDNVNHEGIYYSVSSPIASAERFSSIVWASDQHDKYQFVEADGGVMRSWRHGKNYPTLNALLPDGATPWSIKCESRPTSDSNFRAVAKLVDMSKFYDQGAATKTITGNILIHEGFDPAHNVNAAIVPQKDQWWMVINYIDSTNVRRTETTFASGALSTSTETWSSTTYGADTYDRYGLSLTTQHSIKNNSLIHINIYTNINPPVGANFYFIDPEVSIA